MLRNLPSTVPPFYFPTRVLHIDDNETYLKVMRPHLDVTLESFSSAGEALDQIASAEGTPGILRSLVRRRAKGSEAELVLDVPMIHQIMYDPRRFNIPSVVVADYAMPEMTGLEFLSSCAERHVGRILLTGQANKETVIQGFNDGLIDHYIEKSSTTAIDDLSLVIDQLQWRYFASAFASVAQSLSRDDFGFLWDAQAFGALLGLLPWEACEMYVHNAPNGVLFLNEEAQGMFVVVYSPSSLLALMEAAEGADVSAEDISRMGSEEWVPVFHEGHASFVRGQVNYEMIPVEPLRTADGTYLVGVLEDLSRFKLDQVTSYGAWLDQHEAG
ncbi:MULTISPECIES: response regulator [unclassified Rhodanobacter]|uniref:response regulator n=1 Tax=unclassified Rhodanobacter TaxID=2621553 RepID=UPI0007AA07D3|nr:response regulator [Rhodanobacter sp. FW510-R10]KZC32594.1 hypothetical protein RhoFW510R10_11810 [Rhodanobacter sp. FW510-R10]